MWCQGKRVDTSGSHLYDVAPIHYYHALDTTSDVFCNGNGVTQPGDVIHTEARYVIDWADGTHTVTRDDNSYDWTASGGALGCDHS